MCAIGKIRKGDSGKLMKTSKDPLTVLKNILKKGFDDPIITIDFLKQRNKCSACSTKPCQSILPHFSGRKPWDHTEFWEWCWSWCTRNFHEYAVCALFVNTWVGQLLTSKGIDESSIRNNFRMEFTGGRICVNAPICFWRKSLRESTTIGKKFRDRQQRDRKLSGDFFLFDSFPPTVAEVKVAMPDDVFSSKITEFRDDLKKCKEWLKPDTALFVQEKFPIKKFDYALAILVDLTGGTLYRNWWESNIDKEYYSQQGILAWLFSP
jgi:hypothetical protein